MPRNVTENTNKEDVIAAIRKCAEDLGHVPSMDELLRVTGMSKYLVRRHFGAYTKALEACGLERHGCGYRVEMKNLFLDWAAIVRKLGKVPSMLEYELHGKYTTKPLNRHFGGWTHVAAGLMAFAREAQLEVEWADVLEVSANHLKYAPPPARTPVLQKNLLPQTRKLAGRTVYGTPMARTPMVFEPTNEAGVSVLFGAVAYDLGFSILHVQQGFPDCEVMREIEPGKCQREIGEFEYESRNFLTHGHAVEGCDIIICWIHNWPECPLEVLELRSAVRRIGSSGDRVIG